MSDTKFVVGGREYLVPPLTIYALKKCWGDVKTIGTATDIIESVEAQLRVMVAGLSLRMPDLTVEALEKDMSPSEIPALDRSVKQLFDNSGMVAKAPDQPGEAPAASSTETGTS